MLGQPDGFEIPRAMSSIDAPLRRFVTAEWVFPVSSEPIYQGVVAFERGRLAAVGPITDFPNLPFPSPGTFLSPGLVNAHTHLEQSFSSPVPKLPGEPFSQWLLEVVSRNRVQAEPAQKTARCRFGAQELLETGTTCVNDIASGSESLSVLEETGLRGIVSLECFHPAPRPVDIRRIVDLYEAFRQGYESHPRLRAGLSPHSLYNVSPAAWSALKEACDPPFVHSHVAEWAGEMAYFRDEESPVTGLHETLLRRRFPPPSPAQTPIRHLADRGLLDSRTLLAHVVHTTREDRSLLAQYGVSVAHCPRSNRFLHGDTLCWADWKEYGVPLGLGSDGRLSVENLDLRAEARLAMSLHGWSAAKALETLTLSGATALGLQTEIGSLEVGKCADFVLWRASPALCGTDEAPESRWMAEPTQAEAVYVDGECLWRRERIPA